MKKWYCVLLLAGLVGGWAIYPHVYPAMVALISGGAFSWGDRTDTRYQAVVTIEGDRSRGTGFVTKSKGTFYILTNQHVLAGNSKLTVSDSAGRELKGGNIIAARSADLAMIEIENPRRDQPFMKLAAQPEQIASIGDAVVIPGDRHGVGVITECNGTILEVGPRRIEVNAPLRSGNNGSPIFHLNSRTALGVLTKARTLTLDEINWESLQLRNASFKSEIRYLGHRVDTINGWRKLDWSDFQADSKSVATAWKELETLHRYTFRLFSAEVAAEFDELSMAHSEVVHSLRRDRASRQDKRRALKNLVRTMRFFASRRIRHLETRKLHYIHEKELKHLKSFAAVYTEGLDFAEREFDLFVDSLGL